MSLPAAITAPAGKFRAATQTLSSACKTMMLGAAMQLRFGCDKKARFRMHAMWCNNTMILPPPIPVSHSHQRPKRG